jgi:VIT1/CCC1 family predicted Fe2+/Mn2+ transporter
MPWMSSALYFSTMAALLALGLVSAHLGGSSKTKAMTRILVWGTLALGASAMVGRLFGVKL